MQDIEIKRVPVPENEPGEQKNPEQLIQKEEGSAPKTKKPGRFAAAASKYLDMAVKFLIYGTIALFPLVYLSSTYDVLELPKQALLGIFVSITIIAWLFSMVLKRNFRLKRTPFDVPILVFVGAYLIASLVSISPSTSIIGFYGRLSTGLLPLVYLVGLYYAVVNNMKTKKEISGVFLALFVSTILAAGIGFLQTSGAYILPGEITKSKVFNTVGTINALAVFLAAMIPFGVAQSLKKEGETKISFIAVSAFMFVLLVLLNVKAAWWGLFASGTFIAVLAGLKQKKDWRMLAFPAALALLSLAFVFNASFGKALPKEATLDRDIAQSQVKQVLKEKPIFGSGPETYVFDFSKYRTDEMNNSQVWSLRFDKARNDWLNMLATTGILGTAAYALLVVFAVVLGAMQFLKTEDESEKFLELGAIGSIVTIAVMGLFYYSTASLLLVLWVSLAILGAISAREKTKTEQEFDMSKISLESRVFAFVFLMLIFGGAAYSILYNSKVLAADIKYRKGLEFAQKAETLSDSARMFEGAIRQNGLRENYHLSLARVYLIQANLENQKGEKDKKVETVQNLLTRAIDEGKVAVNINPVSVANWEGMALIYRNAALYATGALDWIETSYNEALKLEPSNPIIVNGLGQVYLTKPDVDKAKEYFERAIKMKADLPDPHFNLAIVYTEKKEYDKALSEIDLYSKYMGGETEDAKKAKEEINKLKNAKVKPTPSTDKLKGKPPAEVEKEKAQEQQQQQEQSESTETTE